MKTQLPGAIRSTHLYRKLHCIMYRHSLLKHCTALLIMSLMPISHRRQYTRTRQDCLDLSVWNELATRQLREFSVVLNMFKKFISPKPAAKHKTDN